MTRFGIILGYLLFREVRCESFADCILVLSVHSEKSSSCSSSRTGILGLYGLLFQVLVQEITLFFHGMVG